MEFKSKDLLDYTNLETLITTQFPNEKAKLISSKLLNYLFIQNSTLYILQKNKTFKAIVGDARASDPWPDLPQCDGPPQGSRCQSDREFAV